MIVLFLNLLLAWHPFWLYTYKLVMYVFLYLIIIGKAFPNLLSCALSNALEASLHNKVCLHKID
jgi:hypothetical protein